MLRRITANILFISCLLLWGCASIPLSTLARMSTFDERDFAKLDAEEVRIKIRFPAGFGLDVSKSWLGIEIASAAGSHEATFKLEEDRTQPVQLPAGPFSDPKPGIEYELRLSAPSKVEFRKLQAFVAEGKAEDINIRVVPKLSSSPLGASSVKVWIDLLLSKQQGYLALVDGAVISLEKRQ